MNLNTIDISKLPSDVRKTYRQLQVLHAEKQIQNRAKSDFLSFVKCVWPDFIEGSHHRHISEKFNKLARGEISRLIVNMPPRHTKSEFASYLLPAWMVGRDPKLKIIQVTHTGELAIRFGRKAKHLIDSEDYHKIFDTRLQEDSKAAGRWETAQGGEYFAAGVGGAITGRGADLLIIDDPHSEQDALSETALESAHDWYTSGPRQRLQPGGKIVLVMTRWSTKDLTGILLKNQGGVKADQWGRGRISGNHGPRTCMARILECRRAGEGKSHVTRCKMECTVDAVTNFGRRSAYQARMVEKMDRSHSTASTCYTILRYSLSEEGNGGLFGNYDLGHLYTEPGPGFTAYFARCCKRKVRIPGIAKGCPGAVQILDAGDGYRRSEGLGASADLRTKANGHSSY